MGRLSQKWTKPIHTINFKAVDLISEGVQFVVPRDRQ